MDLGLALNINRMMRTGLGGLGSDLRAQVIEALFGNGEDGVYIANRDGTYFTDTGATTAAAIDDTAAAVVDSSGNGYTFTQLNTSEQAARREAGLEFDGVNDAYSTTSKVFGGVADSHTAIIAQSLDAAISTFIFTPESNEFFQSSFNAGKVRAVIRQASGFTVAESPSSVGDGVMRIITLQWNRATRALIVRINGVQVASETGFDENLTDYTASNFGHRAGAFEFDGIISDAAHVNRALSTAEIEDIEGKFATLNGVTL